MADYHWYRRRAKLFGWVNFAMTLLQSILLIMTFILLKEAGQTNYRRFAISFVISEPVREDDYFIQLPWIEPYMLAVDTVCNVIQMAGIISLILATDIDRPPFDATKQISFFYWSTLIILVLEFMMIPLDYTRFFHTGFTLHLVAVAGVFITHPFLRELEDRLKSTRREVMHQRGMRTVRVTTV